jgi:hypothetical protein
MASPAAVNIHGSADALNDIQDEANLDVQDYKAKFSRETQDRKNHYGNLRRRKYFNPITAISFTAFVVTAAGLADQHPGTRVTSLVNFAAEKRVMDPAAGTMMLDDAEDSLSLEEDLKTAMNITHAPFVITA